jgi:hypothetical protein
MADGKNGTPIGTGTPAAPSNGGNGTTKIATLIEESKVVRDRAVEELKALKQPEKTDVFKSILRVKHDETPRSRALGVLSNVFLHLHPAKINRDAVAYNYTWGMGGMTFYVYLTLVFTGTLLMFYYHPSKSCSLPRHSVSRATCRTASCCAICIAGART